MNRGQGYAPARTTRGILTACSRDRGTWDPTMSTNTNAVESVTLDVTGMSCGSCERRVTNALNEVRGFRDANVDRVSGRVCVSYESGTATPEQLASAIVNAGYAARVAAR